MKKSWLNKINEVISQNIESGILHKIAEDLEAKGRTIRIDGRDLINLGSASYLGLELDQRLKAGTIDATIRYGTQFASSRAYVSSPLYLELEALLGEIFDAPIIVTPSTSLGHLSALPTLIYEGDAVILDQQVHTSVKTATELLQASGVHIEFCSHNQLSDLDHQVSKLSQKFRHVWYLADGIYSMYGDLAPVRTLMDLLKLHPQLHLYFDDAHGMSWTGKKGRGYVLSQIENRERVFVATSLNKAFSAAGGVLIFPDKKSHQLVRNCGAPLLFSGPIQPPMLGAAIASAKIHLSPDLEVLQKAFKERIRFCSKLLEDQQLPLASSDESPIFFFRAPLPDPLTLLMIQRIILRGFYVHGASFPAVPLRKSGIRFSLNLHQKLEDIQSFLEILEEEYDTIRSQQDLKERVARPLRTSINAIESQVPTYAGD